MSKNWKIFWIISIVLAALIVLAIWAGPYAFDCKVTVTSVQNGSTCPQPSPANDGGDR
jgi:hypothetical protein